MGKRYNLLSFYLILVCLALVLYSLYSIMNNTWLIAPPNYVLLLMSLLTLVLGAFGFKDKRNWLVKIRSWLTLIVSSLTSIGLLLILLISFLFPNEYIKTIGPSDNSYSIDFYRWDMGAAGTFGILGELNGPLWFKKRIYNEVRTENVKVKWENNSKVSINNHILNLNHGDTYGYK
ncbi:DUF5412 family protein [Pullulanibacillus sp. KACC 23026]|uniref:DUF5412 family protein n=1 Tax=Pullulanibacillus sp. KACC 23026 TaxID=3028315 RepID=UPI0023AF2916|nr:DUF5412 family protein [Pullulanibacillus sp. KACC 23026]WEG14475.1 DUF5412 family protein [Pullulanibacillus sp. KACC 23026]